MNCECPRRMSDANPTRTSTRANKAPEMKHSGGNPEGSPSQIALLASDHTAILKAGDSHDLAQA